MTTFLIDIGIVGIVVFCAWRGFRNGLIRGAFGVVTLIVALFLANTVARAYADEFTGVLNPFARGMVEGAILELSGADESFELDFDSIDPDDIDLSGIDLGDIDLAELDFGDIYLGDFDLEEFDIEDITLGTIDSTPEKFITTYLALRQIGMLDAAATNIAQVSSEDVSGRFLPSVVGDNLSLYLSYIALLSISFLLLAIVFTVIGNLINVVFTIPGLPGLKIIDGITGVAFGFIKGLIIILAIGVFVRYFGMLFTDIVEETSALYHIVNNNMIATMLGV